MQVACCSGNLKLINLLIEEGSDINSIDNKGRTAMHLSSYYGHKDCLMELATEGASSNINDKYNRKPIHLAAMKGHPDACSYLTGRADCDHNSLDSFHRNALHYSLMGKTPSHLEISDMLLYDCDVNQQDVNGNTPFMIAVYNNHFTIINRLECVNINIQNIKGQTSLIIASYRGFSKIVKLLLNKGNFIFAIFKFTQYFLIFGNLLIN